MLAVALRLCTATCMLAAGCEAVAPYSASPLDTGPDVVSTACITAKGCVECDPVTANTCPAGCDAAPVDAAPVDAAPVDAAPQDAAPQDATGSAEASGGGGGAGTGAGAGGGADASSCTPGCDGGDCDPLPPERDPWPTACNALEYQEDFFDAPRDWGRSYNKLFIDVKACGLLQWSCPPHHTIWAWLDDELGAKLSRGGLVETRLIPRRRGIWSFTLGAEVVSKGSTHSWPESQGRSCALSYSEASHRFRLTSRVIDAEGTHSETATAHGVDGNPVLQSWMEGGKHHCRLLPAKPSSKPTTVSVDAPATLSGQGTIKLALVNQEQEAPHVWLWLDYVRFYAPPR
jgi:hypothetical protein